MITLQEAERLLERYVSADSSCPSEPSASGFLTTLVSAGAFERPAEQTLRAALVAEGVPGNAVNYTLRVLRKLGVIS